MNKIVNSIVRPDAKGRINLGDFAQGVSSYRISCAKNGELTLIPYAEIPFSDKWIFENEELLEKVKQQLKTEATDSSLYPFDQPPPCSSCANLLSSMHNIDRMHHLN